MNYDFIIANIGEIIDNVKEVIANISKYDVFDEKYKNNVLTLLDIIDSANIISDQLFKLTNE